MEQLGVPHPRGVPTISIVRSVSVRAASIDQVASSTVRIIRTAVPTVSPLLSPILSFSCYLMR
jgi:hypothetical protein